MDNVLKKLFSMKVGMVLLFVFALSCAVATFIENDFGTESAFALVYGSWWFEVLQVYLALLVFYNLFRFNLFRKDKIPSLIFHFSFLLILLGAGLTRYYGFEGILHIREGESENRLVSSEPFIQIKAVKDKKVYKSSQKKLISQVGGNSFNLSLDIDGKKANFTYKKLIPNAVQKIVQDEKGKPLISIVATDNGNPREITLQKGQSVTLSDTTITFDTPPTLAQADTLYLFLENDTFYLYSHKKISWFKMLDSSKGEYSPKTKTPFIAKQLYTINEVNIVPKALVSKGIQKWVQGETGSKNSKMPSALIGKLTYKNESKEVALLGYGRGYKGYESQVDIQGQSFFLEWGSKMFVLPFSLQLIDFQLERYPGSMSPSSYASEVRVVDKKQGVNKPFRIYMNHVLDYRGFRFFQSSYDKDELGTILSVNQDPGKIPTYMGYFLLFLGLFINILNPKSRFRKLAKSLNQNSQKQKAQIATIALFALSFIFTPNPLYASSSQLTKYDKHHADTFGRVIVQSSDGRMKPIDTLSHEVLNKVYRGYEYKGLSPNQVLLGMLTTPNLWQNEPMIKVYDKKLKKIIGIEKNSKYATFNDFFENMGKKQYKLTKYVEQAHRKKPSARNLFDKDVLKVDERLNICYYVYTGEILRMIPKIGDKNRTWFSPKTAIMSFPKQESDAVKITLEKYFDGVEKGLKSGDWKDADKGVEYIIAYQRQFSNDMIPSKNRIETEIKFNNFQIFEKLTPIYLFLGLLLLLVIFLKMLAPKIGLNWARQIAFGVIAIAFIAHTIGLGMRWYISKHAPWSDSYESMIYIAWALALSGILFSRRSPISLALTAILTGVVLFVAHLAWMDPQITNLVPVLKSYWLTIHVSVITASYGFFGLCALLGFFTLILFIIKNPKRNNARALEIDKNITEATKINEMAMILGLTLLTIGNFLGGIWANESWGRYWGWDAKETWALISILIYACVVHFRFIPKLNNQYAFAVASTFAYWSILMTYFGVNFYLSGMHSYAAGDPVPIPTFVPIMALTMLGVSLLAFFKRNSAKTL